MKWSIGDGPVSVIAHRGDAASSRENTLPAIVDAIRAGADAVEVDVKITADGEVILLHDRDLQRLWNGDDRAVAERGFAEIVEFVENSGSWHQIPTLTSALALTGGTGADLLIDLDHADWAAPARRVIDEAVSEKLITAAEVSWCGRPDAMSIIRETDPEARIVLSWDEETVGGDLPDDDLLNTLRPEAFNPHWPMITPETRAWAHDRELALSCWTIDDADQANRALDLGVDAIITNDIRTVLRLRRERPTRSAR